MRRSKKEGTTKGTVLTFEKNNGNKREKMTQRT